VIKTSQWFEALMQASSQIFGSAGRSLSGFRRDLSRGSHGGPDFPNATADQCHGCNRAVEAFDRDLDLRRLTRVLPRALGAIMDTPILGK
jgi:hypothetical protein